jgi:TPR repeat protein
MTREQVRQVAGYPDPDGYAIKITPGSNPNNIEDDVVIETWTYGPELLSFDRRQDRLIAITGTTADRTTIHDAEFKHLTEIRAKAEAGDAQAQCELGYTYRKGELGVTKDDAEAVKWYRKAAEQNLAKAQYNLGICYAYGEGVSKDQVEAEKWWRLAAQNGDEDAKTYMRQHGGLDITTTGWLERQLGQVLSTKGASAWQEQLVLHSQDGKNYTVEPSARCRFEVPHTSDGKGIAFQLGENKQYMIQGVASEYKTYSADGKYILFSGTKISATWIKLTN